MKSKGLDGGKENEGGLFVTHYGVSVGGASLAIVHRVADIQDDETLCGLSMGLGAAKRIELGWGVLRDREPGEVVCVDCDIAAGSK